MKDILLNGLGLQDLALFLARITLGGFYVLARFRFFYDPSRPDAPICNPRRRANLADKMRHCGWNHWSVFWACVVASVEVFAGFAVIVGIFTIPAAIGLLAVTVAATICTARDKVMEQNPVDIVACLECYLWRVEGLYIALALLLILAGPGKWSLDAVLLS